MERFNTHQCGSFEGTIRKMRKIMVHRNAPTEATMRKLIKKFLNSSLHLLIKFS